MQLRRLRQSVDACEQTHGRRRRRRREEEEEEEEIPNMHATTKKPKNNLQKTL
jgi:hypothetical protein